MLTVRLSERNLRVLLSKLERKARGEETACTLIKADQDVTVIAVPDDEYYKDRLPGVVHPFDDPRSSGIMM